MLTPIDHYLRDLCQRAQYQADALELKLTAVIDGMDDEGEPEDDKLCGIATETDKRLGDRAVMVFAPPYSERHRTLVYVDAILELAKLLNRERPLGKVEDLR